MSFFSLVILEKGIFNSMSKLVKQGIKKIYVTIWRSEKLGRSAKLMARPLAHSCPLARRFGGLREVSDIEEGKRRSVEGKGVSWSLRESMEVE